MKKILLSLTCLVVLHASPVLARDAAFVSAERVQAFKILPEPAASTSELTQAELLELHRIESTRTPEQVERAMADDKNESIYIFQTLMGEDFTAAKTPLTDALSHKLNNDESVNTAPAKNGFKRVRPYNLDKTLHPVCATKTKNDSYPSGHTTTGYLMALALIDMVPEKRDAILARADDYANNRLICGVHYPSDLQASKLIAYSMHAVMGTNPKYQKELGAAKLELRRVLGLANSAN